MTNSRIASKKIYSFLLRLPNLRVLLMQNTSITNLQWNFFEQLQNLSVLELHGNHIHMLTSRCFLGLSHVLLLDLHNMTIRSMHSKSFEGMASLRLLNLSYNELEHLTSGTIQSAENLTIIDLRGNLFTDVDLLFFYDKHITIYTSTIELCCFVPQTSICYVPQSSYFGHISTASVEQQESFCDSLLTAGSLRVFWVALIAPLLTISVLIYINISSTFTVQTIVCIHSMVNLLIIFCTTLLVLSMHYTYAFNYQLTKSNRYKRVDCIIHSSLNSFTLLIPSSSLVLLLVIHYRAIFWVRFNCKLQVKHLVPPVLLIWLISVVVTVIWTTLHRDYSSWYCHPFVSSFAWTSIVLQCCVSSFWLACMALCVGCYGKMIAHLHKEENIVQEMRSRQISHTKMIVIRFIYTFVFYLAQGVLLNTMMWLPLFGYSEQVVAFCNAMYILTVAITDLYMHAYVSLKNIILNKFLKKPKLQQ